MFNDVLGGGTPAAKLDGRTAKRRERLLRELEENRAHGQRELKPLDVLQRIQELLELGEPLTSIKKVRKVPKPTAAKLSQPVIKSTLRSPLTRRQSRRRWLR